MDQFVCQCVCLYACLLEELLPFPLFCDLLLVQAAFTLYTRHL